MVFDGSLRVRQVLSPSTAADHLHGTGPAADCPQGALVRSEGAASSRHLRGLNPLLFWKKPTFTAAVLFLLILSGPPKLRIRDPEASLRGDIDWIVALQLFVWGLAGLWVFLQLGTRFYTGRRLLRLRLPQILGLATILCLAISITVSAAPSLTAFKVYQMLVSMLLSQTFMERFGIAAAYKTIFWGITLLCVAIAICAFLAPDLVWTASEFNPEPSRLFGDRIAQAGVVSVLALILLLTGVRGIWKPLPLSLLLLFLTLLVLSLLRTGYVTALVFLLLVLLRRPEIKDLRRFAYVLSGLLLTLFALSWLPSVNQYRDPDTIATLGDRVGLWRHLTSVTLNQSPWFGLGYYSASRIHGPEYNPGLGTAHSMFFEVLSGGGMLAFAFFLALCVTLCVYAVRLLYMRKDRISFAAAALFIACLLLGFTEETIDAGPVAICFWCSVAILPSLHKWPTRRNPLAQGAAIHATSGL